MGSLNLEDLASANVHIEEVLNTVPMTESDKQRFIRDIGKKLRDQQVFLDFLENNSTLPV